MREERPADLQDAVRAFWEREACGEVYARGASARDRFEEQARQRYALEPYLKPFARFEDAAGRDVLEIGLGLGADHLELARAGPRRLIGVDITNRAAAITAERLALYGFPPRTLVGDAAHLPFRDGSFDLVYSWGVLHHAADTPRTIREVHRVLRPGGIARVMLYHRRSLVGMMLWARYGLLRGRPWLSLRRVFAAHMESPGTTAYTRVEARRVFRDFRRTAVGVQLTFADLLEGASGQQHHGVALALARRVWPRRTLRRLANGFGLNLLIEAVR
jgi:SAM-dependent methyltransferase